jgi:hypothetical protein
MEHSRSACPRPGVRTTRGRGTQGVPGAASASSLLLLGRSGREKAAFSGRVLTPTCLTPPEACVSYPMSGAVGFARETIRPPLPARGMTARNAPAWPPESGEACVVRMVPRRFRCRPDNDRMPPGGLEPPIRCLEGASRCCGLLPPVAQYARRAMGRTWVLRSGAVCRFLGASTDPSCLRRQQWWVRCLSSPSAASDGTRRTALQGQRPDDGWPASRRGHNLCDRSYAARGREPSRQAGPGSSTGALLARNRTHAPTPLHRPSSGVQLRLSRP